jgi:peptidoglycan hydrolase-like protein with peptidoglycan-binding domain
MIKIIGLGILLVLSGCGKKSETPVPQPETAPLETTVEIPAPSKELAPTVPVEESTVVVPQETAKSTPENIQQALKNAGLYDGSIDGKIGPKTKRAIEEFQRQNDLQVDGKVGQKTWEKLKVFLAMPEPNPAPAEGQ